MKEEQTICPICRFHKYNEKICFNKNVKEVGERYDCKWYDPRTLADSEKD